MYQMSQKGINHEQFAATEESFTGAFHDQMLNVPSTHRIEGVSESRPALASFLPSIDQSSPNFFSPAASTFFSPQARDLKNNNSFVDFNASLTSFQSTMRRNGSKDLLMRTGMIGKNDMVSAKAEKMSKVIQEREKDHYCGLRDNGTHLRPINQRRNPFGNGLFVTEVKRRYERTFPKREMHIYGRSGFNQKLQEADATDRPLLKHSDTSLEKMFRLASPTIKRKGNATSKERLAAAAADNEEQRKAEFLEAFDKTYHRHPSFKLRQYMHRRSLPVNGEHSTDS